MEQLFREYFELLNNIDFKKFQNDLSQKIYDALTQGYISRDNEIDLVGRLVNVVNGLEFKRFKFYSHKIHGAKSYVEFNYRNKPIIKEIADMVIICIATYKRNRIFQKITFIQNKVDMKKKWFIDEEQLFLLKNFPKLIGNRGIFKSYSNDDIVFFNYSQCLGSFGLFMHPGEMLFISAPLLSELKKDKEINYDDIKIIEPNLNISSQNIFFPFMYDYSFMEEFFHYMSKYSRKYAYYPFISNITFPFLNNSVFSRDIYDFIRNWSQFNIGEPTYAFGNVINPELDKFSNYLLRTIGLENHIDLPSYNLKENFNNEMALFVMHIDLGKEYIE